MRQALSGASSSTDCESACREWSISKDALAEYAVKHSQLNKDYPMVHLAICDHAPKASDELRIEVSVPSVKHPESSH